MAGLSDFIGSRIRGHDFGPDDSTILSTLYHPAQAGRKLADFLRLNYETAAGLNSGYDNPNPMLGPSDESRVNSALTLAGLMQTGALPFGPKTKGGTLGAIPVWHGSPHKFDKFDMSKIGTGEGAQAYGHGLYFAESPVVAEVYKTANVPGTSKFESVVYGGQVYPHTSALGQWLHEISIAGSAESSIANLEKQVNRLSKNYPEMADKLKNQITFLKSVNPAAIKINNGNIYKASLEWPDPAREAADPLGPQHFLAWDKPLSEQPEGVISALKRSRSSNIKSMLEYLSTPYPEYIGGEQKTLESGLRLLGLNLDGRTSMNSPKAAALLSKQGIPGIRYLDGVSRGAGEGFSNYVVFDDKIPRIIERNGKTLAEMLKK